MTLWTTLNILWQKYWSYINLNWTDSSQKDRKNSIKYKTYYIVHQSIEYNKLLSYTTWQAFNCINWKVLLRNTPLELPMMALCTRILLHIISAAGWSHSQGTNVDIVQITVHVHFLALKWEENGIIHMF